MSLLLRPPSTLVFSFLSGANKKKERERKKNTRRPILLFPVSFVQAGQARSRQVIALCKVNRELPANTRHNVLPPSLFPLVFPAKNLPGIWGVAEILIRFDPALFPSRPFFLSLPAFVFCFRSTQLFHRALFAGLSANFFSPVSKRRAKRRDRRERSREIFDEIESPSLPLLVHVSPFPKIILRSFKVTSLTDDFPF